MTVGLVLGLLYQLNTAFQSWAASYFGDYLSCLLETGELPSIGGAAPGDSGECNNFFETFSWSKGRPLNAALNVTDNYTGGAGAGGARESGQVGPSGAVGNYVGGSGLGSGRAPPLNGPGRGRAGADAYTGNTKAGNYGGGYSDRSGMQNQQDKTRLDETFAFDDEKPKTRRTEFNAQRSTASDSGMEARNHRDIRRDRKADNGNGPSAGMTFPDFIRYLIIAAIVIALVFFLGGQMLQVSKSME